MVTVRRAGRGDAEAIVELALAAFDGYVAPIGRRPAPMDSDYHRAVDHDIVWVAEDAGHHVIGYVVIEVRDNHVHVDSLAVSPHTQGSGIGGMLIDLAETEARNRGLAEVRLCTNEMMTENLIFYPRRGFEETHRGEEDGFRRVYFSKRL